MDNKIRVTVWNEFRHEKTDKDVAAIYPNGIHARVAEFLGECPDLEVRLAALDDPDNGLPPEVLDNTDVLMWWGHMAHGEVPDELVERIKHRVYDCGMGFVAMHSAHHSKPFRALVGCSGNLTWGDEQKEIVWNLMPGHPIAAGIPDHFVIDSEEMYGEPFVIPQPDALIFSSWFKHGNIFRSGACFLRGAGKIFYFQPGHETSASFYNPYVIRILQNGVHWAAPADFGYDVGSFGCPYVRPFDDEVCTGEPKPAK